MHKISRIRGFSFIELVTAITVLSIGLLPIMWFFSRSNAGTVKTRDEIVAQQYAAELYDFVIASGYDAFAPTDEAGIEIPSITIDGETLSIDDHFKRRLIIEDLAPTHNTEWPLLYRTLAVEVNWLAEQQQRTLRLTGIIYAPK
ncbi:MAG: prepilin-type N-terminal cleavage/methylation domain-containing protein [Candidatus Riflebacteria bacterium]|nr:prepilin-type N-terminal cleavage/methylation domain-containing protein [Candidatus Riflebacteria bacterium]